MWWRLPFCTLGIWVCFLSYGVILEGISLYRSPQQQKFAATTFLNGLEALTSASVAFFALAVFKQSSKQSYVPFLGINGAIAAAQCAAKFCSVESLQYVSFPIQALAKSSKTVPAMLGSFFSGKKFTVIQWMSGLGITAGTALFSILGSSKGGEIRVTRFGVCLLCGSLLCDGIVASSQQSLRSMSKSQSLKPLTPYEQMFFTNVGIFFCLLPFAFWKNEINDGIAFLSADRDLLFKVMLLCMTSALGQVFIFLTVVWLGPEVNAKITTVRKMATVVLSIVVYGHVVELQQMAAIGLVFASVVAELLEQVFKSKPREHGKSV